MVKAACHCTAVRLELARLPKRVFDCNCTLCRRYGALWAHYEFGDVTFVCGVDALDEYVWGDGEYGFHRCRTCGCVTHFTRRRTDPPSLRAVNARMIPTLDPSTVRLQHTDNSHTGWFWTRTPDDFQPGEQPMMPRPGNEDWR